MIFMGFISFTSPVVSIYVGRVIKPVSPPLSFEFQRNLKRTIGINPTKRKIGTTLIAKLSTYLHNQYLNSVLFKIQNFYLKVRIIVEQLFPFLLNFIPKFCKLLFAFSVIHQLFNQSFHSGIVFAQKEQSKR